MKSPEIAPDIHELIDYLNTTHQPGDLYRGQNTDYPAMAPSFFRPVAADLSSPDPIIAINPIRFDTLIRDNIRLKLKDQFMNHLIGDFGLGLGNILAQQYGLGSETIDITSDINVAAYFATRKYPTYAHIESGQGVIYRFRQLESDGLISPYTLTHLNDHLERGMNSDGFFDFFVHEDKRYSVFDRDKWWLTQEGVYSKAWTLRFVSDHSSLRIAAEEEIKRILKGDIFYQGPYSYNFDWEKTRFFAQSGGLIRPRIYWEAEIPTKFQLAENSYDALKKRMQNSVEPLYNTSLDREDNYFPLVLPSAAIKRSISGVENLRTSSCCHVFLFNHSNKRITGMYRRKLWPEPSEDPFYGAFWQLGIHIYSMHYGLENMPPIDDTTTGILDRGYHVSGETNSRDGREDKELLRGQFEDAQENQTFGSPTAQDFCYQMNPLIADGNYRGAVLAGLRGLRINAIDQDILLGLVTCFERLNKFRWAEKTLDYVLELSSKHVYALYLKSMSLTRVGKFGEAISLLDSAIEFYNQKPTDFSDFFLVELRGILAFVTGDFVKYKSVVKELISKGYTADSLPSQITFLMRKFPDKFAKEN